MRTILRGGLAGSGGGGGGGLLLTFGLGGASGGGIDVEGAVCTFEGPVGICGTFSMGIIGLDGVAGVAAVSLTVELSDVFTGPWGRGSFVLELMEPGSTIGFESLILGLSARFLWIQSISISCLRFHYQVN